MGVLFFFYVQEVVHALEVCQVYILLCTCMYTYTYTYIYLCKCEFDRISSLLKIPALNKS